MIVMASIILLSTLGNAITAFREGGVVEYDEVTFQAYADDCYRSVFGDSTAYEDNILIVFLTDEACENYYCITWVGDHIVTRVNDMFGGAGSTFGRAIENSVNATTYVYSLDSDLARAIGRMEEAVTTLNTDVYHSCKEQHVQVEPQFVNRTSLDLTEATVTDALVSFTEKTEIPIAIVVDDMEAVFGRTMPGEYVMTLLIAGVFFAVGIFLIVRAVKEKRNWDKNHPNGKNGGDDSQSGSQSGSQNSSQNGKRSSYDGGRTDFH